MNHEKLACDTYGRKLSLSEHTHHEIVHHRKRGRHYSLNGDGRCDPHYFYVDLFFIEIHSFESSTKISLFSIFQIKEANKKTLSKIGKSSRFPGFFSRQKPKPYSSEKSCFFEKA